MMDTSTAKSEITRFLHTFKAAKHMEEVLATAVAAEQVQSELTRANEKLDTQRDQAAKAVDELNSALLLAQKNQKTVLAALSEDEKTVRAQVVKSEEAAKKLTENLKAGYKASTSALDADFQAKKQDYEDTLEDLERKIASAKVLLQDTRDKFREIA